MISDKRKRRRYKSCAIYIVGCDAVTQSGNRDPLWWDGRDWIPLSDRRGRSLSSHYRGYRRVAAMRIAAKLAAKLPPNEAVLVEVLRGKQGRSYDFWVRGTMRTPR